MALTENRVLDLRGVGFVFDTKVAGLAVRITANEAKTYVYQRKLKGRPVRIALGKCAGLRLDAARAAVERLNGQVAAGLDLKAERAQAKAAERLTTLAQAFEAFKAAKDRRASTLLDYETIWRLHIPARLKSKPFSEVGAADIEAVKARLLTDRTGVTKADGTSGKPRSAGKARTAAKVITLLAAILNKVGRRADNPAREVTRPEAKVRTRRLSANEVAAVLRVLEERRGQLFADFIAVALLTGARRGALCSMRWEDLHLDEALWIVPATWSKNRKELVVALPTKALEILRARRGSSRRPGWVWPSQRSASGHIVNPDKPLAEVLSVAKVTRVSMHDLRRTLGSRLAMTGAGAATISAALGHISPQSAKAYTHIDVGHARAAMEKAIDAS